MTGNSFPSKISRIKSAIRFIENSFTQLVNIGLSLLDWLPWTLLIGMLPGLIAWQVRHMDRLNNLQQNDINFILVATYGVVSTMIYYALCVTGHMVFGRRRNLKFAAFCRKINRFTSILIIAPIYFYIVPQPDVKSAPFFTMLLCTISGGIAAWAAYAIPGIDRFFASRQRMRHTVPLLVVTLLATAWAVALSKAAFFHHAHLGTAGWDFGLYINTMWNSIHGHPLACSLTSEGTHASRHFDPILILLSPVILIRQGAEAQILSSLQCGWIAAGAIPLYLLAARQSGNAWVGVVMVIGYLLHPVFHGPAVYEFHSLVLGGPLMLWCMLFLETGAFKRFFLALVLLLLTREDMSIIALLIGLYAFISKKPRWVAMLAMVIPLAYGAIVYFAVFSKAISYASYFNEVSNSKHSVSSKLALTLITNPLYLTKYMFSEKKIVYILQLLVPLLFLPIFSGKYRLLFAFGLLMTLVGSMGRMYSISMQYSTWWLPFLVASVPTAIDNISRGKIAEVWKLDAGRLRGALYVGLIFSAFTMSVAYGIFWPNPSFRTGFSALIRTADPQLQATAKTVASLEVSIPRNASVLATEHLISHFSARKRIWSTEKMGYRFKNPDFGIVWNQDLKFQMDRKQKVKRRQKFVTLLRDTRHYQRIFHENGITVYKRKSSHSLKKAVRKPSSKKFESHPASKKVVRQPSADIRKQPHRR